MPIKLDKERAAMAKARDNEIQNLRDVKLKIEAYKGERKRSKDSVYYHLDQHN